MKSIFILAALCSSSAFAAATKTTVRSTTIETTTASAPTLFAPSTGKRVYFTTNMADLAQGTGNVGIDFFLNEKVSFDFNVRTSSNRETVKHNGETGKLTVDRTAYGLGASFWLAGNEAVRNLVLTPYLAFGTKKDALYSDNLSGFGMKVTGVFRVTQDLTAEIGGKGDSLDDGAFKGGIYAGLGYLF